WKDTSISFRNLIIDNGKRKLSHPKKGYPITPSESLALLFPPYFLCFVASFVLLRNKKRIKKPFLAVILFLFSSFFFLSKGFYYF
ncbi:hypothetical protein, partial [uncultured Bacteroides sp.]|uniref:hypothetical protein n=1 Tax=uncultured Bacteroides sp. TaxID=162156 RepID=UPI002610651B